MKLVGKPNAIYITDNDDMMFAIGSRPLGYDQGRLTWCSSDIERLNHLKSVGATITKDDSLLFSLGFEPISCQNGNLVWDEVAQECLEDWYAENMKAKGA